MLVLQAVLGAIAAGLNLTYWWYVVTRGGERFRVWCEAAFDVTIRIGSRGHWQVSGRGWLASLGIELLQLAYFMGAFTLWAASLLAVVGATILLSPR